MNHHDMTNLIDQLHAEWAEFGRMLEERGRRLELRHCGCEGGGACLAGPAPWKPVDIDQKH